MYFYDKKMMRMKDMPNPNEMMKKMMKQKDMPKGMKKMMMKKMKGDKKKSDMMKKCMKCMGHMEELVKLNKQILAELKKLNKKK